MRVLITGSKGFIGKNLWVKLSNSHDYTLFSFERGDNMRDLRDKLGFCDAVVHLAGENRPADIQGFEDGNAKFTKSLCQLVFEIGRPTHLIFASSRHVGSSDYNTEFLAKYAQSKQLAETAVENLIHTGNYSATILRLPGVFGKWGKPNYNSVVSTFCYNATFGKKLNIDENGNSFPLVYIDDVVDAMEASLSHHVQGLEWNHVSPQYQTTAKYLADQISLFAGKRTTFITNELASGLQTDLYLTYLSYQPPEKFVYSVPRAMTLELLSQSNAHVSSKKLGPGTSLELSTDGRVPKRTLLTSGQAEISYSNQISGQVQKTQVNASAPNVIEGIPGWTSIIKNTGDVDLDILIWAGVNSDDTQSEKVQFLC